MANVVFEKKELEKYIKLNSENLEKITMFGTPVEIHGDSVEIEVFPNRPDLLSMQGFVRAINAFIGKSPGIKRYTVKKPESDFKVKVSESVGDVRPYTACAIVKGLKLDVEKIKTIIDVQEKLHITVGRNRKKVAMGIYPLDKISLPIIYEARKPQDISFIPLESNRKMTGSEILRSHPTGREYAHLLSDKEKYPVFVDSKGNILSMPPIINSNETGRITEKTKEVFVECSGHHLPAVNSALVLLVTALADLGGTIYGMEVDYKKKAVTPDLKTRNMKLSLDKSNKTLGLSLKEQDVEKLLPKMGLEYRKGMVEIPAWRTDILSEIDLIEEIAIAYGYDKFIPDYALIGTEGSEAADSELKEAIAILLVGLGFVETSSLHLIKDDEAVRLGINNKIEIESSKTEYKILRPNLMIPFLRTFAENKDNEYPQKIFEIGKIFKKSDKSIIEEKSLSVAVSPSNATQMKQIIDYLFSRLSLRYEVKEEKNSHMIEGRSAGIYLNGEKIGYFGEIHPDTLRKANIKMPVVIAELSFDKIYENTKKNYPK